MDFSVPPLFGYVATFTWAMSGAVVGIRKHFDVTGVFVIALLSSLGGGLIRDAVFLQRTPSMLTDPVYLLLVAAATVLMTVFTRGLARMLKRETAGKLVDLIDGIGIPAFAVVGMQLADDQGIPMIGVVFVGLVNGLAGGLLRDVVVRDVPALLRPGQFTSFSLLLACGLFLMLELYFGVNPAAAGAAPDIRSPRSATVRAYACAQLYSSKAS